MASVPHVLLVMKQGEREECMGWQAIQRRERANRDIGALLKRQSVSWESILCASTRKGEPRDRKVEKKEGKETKESEP